MDIQPFVGDAPITASSVEIRVNPDDRDRAKAVVKWSSAITDVTGEDTFTAARHAAGQLKAMLDEIELSRKQAKTPFTAVGRTIDDVAHQVADPVKNEQNRILGLLNGYVAQLEAARKEEERRQAEARRIALEEAERRINEAEAKLKTAVYEEERLKLQNRLLQEQLAKELAADVDELGRNDEPPPGLVPGGRVDHLYEFELVDVAATVKAGCWRLVKWSLDVLACRDAVKNLIECAPNLEPELPGIKITRKINVSVKASSRIK